MAGALALTLSGALASPGQADDKGDLRNRRNTVTSQIGGAKSDLDESSAALVQTAQAVTAAQRKLGAAQLNLGRTRGQLAVARTRDAALAAKLAAAEGSLAEATAALKQGRQDVRTSRRSVEQFAVESLQNGSPGLRAFGQLLDGADPTQFSEQMSIDETVTDAQTASLDGYDASRVLLVLNKAKVTKLRNQVAAQRAEAAQNLATQQELEAAAQQQTDQVGQLVSATSKAERSAEAAKRGDLAQLQGLEQERARIGNQLKAIAAAEARAAARARARALAVARAQALAKARAEARAKAKRIGRHVAVVVPKISAASVDTAGSGGGVLSRPALGPITSPYGMRLHPILHVWKLHDGTDFGVPCGTPVHAAADGTIIDEYFNAGYGNRVIINHGRMRGVSVATTYNHLSADVAHVGQRVKRGQLIAYSGTTGYSTGCHLHFMVIVNGATVNPMGWL